MKHPERSDAPPRGSPARRTLLVMAITSAAEFGLLGAIFVVHAQGTVPGLALAVVWPWIAALVTTRKLATPGRRTEANKRAVATVRRRLEVRTL
jgi:hypothetical protein